MKINAQLFSKNNIKYYIHIYFAHIISYECTHLREKNVLKVMRIKLHKYFLC